MKSKKIYVALLGLLLLFSCNLHDSSDFKKYESGFDVKAMRSVRETDYFQSRGTTIIDENFESGTNTWSTLNCQGSIFGSGDPGNHAFQIQHDNPEGNIYLYKTLYHSAPISQDMNLRFQNVAKLFSSGAFEMNYYFYILFDSSLNKEPVVVKSSPYACNAGDEDTVSDALNVIIPKGATTVFWAIEMNPTSIDPIIVDEISVSFDENPYIRAVGKGVYNGMSPYTLKSVSFSNYYQAGDDADYTNYAHHNENDWYRVQEMGFNTVRFAYNANWWIENPDKFWTWLDQNVDEAKRAGVYLILDMHVPVGDNYLDQSGDVENRETIFNNQLHKERFYQLTEELAVKYQDEEIIAAYQILNEPVTAREKEQWMGDDANKGMAQELVDLIRNHDRNHMIMVDLVCGENGKYNLGPKDRFFNIDDPDNNIIYNFNYYNPIDFTHQGSTWTEVPMPLDIIYPNPDKIYPKIEKMENYFEGYSPLKAEHQKVFFAGANIETGSEWVDEWTYFESILNIPSDVVRGYYLASFELKAEDFIGNIYVDEIKVERIDNTNEPLIFEDEIDITAGLKYWVETSDDTSADEYQDCYTVEFDEEAKEYYLKVESANVGKATNGSMGRSEYFWGHTGVHKFKISGKFKGLVESGDVGLVVTFYDDFLNDIEYMTEDKEYLEHLLQPFIDWKNSIDAPVSIAEFGIMKYCFENMTGTETNRGGVKYLDDLISIMFEQEIPCFNYWNYHCDTMGIYLHDESLTQPVEDSKPQTALIELLKQKLLP